MHLRRVRTIRWLPFNFAPCGAGNRRAMISGFDYQGHRHELQPHPDSRDVIMMQFFELVHCDVHVVHGSYTVGSQGQGHGGQAREDRHHWAASVQVNLGPHA